MQRVSAASPHPRESLPLTARLWRLLLHPWLSLLMFALALALGLALAYLPQLPPQLLGEPSGASRWTTTVAGRTGLWGNLLLGLGFFNVLHSPLTWFLLLVAATAVAAQLAETVAAMRRLHRWRTHLTTPSSAPTTPVDVGHGPARARRRLGVALSAAALNEIVDDYTATRFDSVTRVEMAAPAADPTAETRFLCLRRPGALRLRVLLPAGLLLALGGLALGLLQGQQSTPPLLAPGAVYRDGLNQLQLYYPPPTDPSQGVTLVVRLGGTERVITPMPGHNYTVGAATVHVGGYLPGLWLSTADGSPQLVRPGGNDATAAVGIACESPGFEDSLLVPAAGAGLRIICGDASPEFRVELYQSDAVQPVLATGVLPDERLAVPVTDTLTLDLAGVPALAVTVSSYPQLWLAWLGVAVALIGAWGFARPTALALVQVVDLGADDSALIVQSDSAKTAQALVDQVVATAAASPPA